MSDELVRVVRPVTVPRQFWVVGGIHSAGAALLLGFVVLVVVKLAADFFNGGRGDANLPMALVVSTVVFGLSFAAFWAFHHWKFIKERGETTYAIYADRVEVAHGGASRPRYVVPLANVAAVQTWSGPLLRPLGLATITLIVDEPSRRGGRAGHRWFPLPNVPEPEETRDLIRSLVSRAAPGRGAARAV